MKRVISSLDCATFAYRGSIALGFTPYAGQPKSGVPEQLTAAGFTAAHVVETRVGFCALAIKP